jgi:hypothetical protein
MRIISCRDMGEYYTVVIMDKSGNITHTVVFKYDKSKLLEECLKFLKMKRDLVSLLENKN